jgi:hypothetical protein
MSTDRPTPPRAAPEGEMDEDGSGFGDLGVTPPGYGNAAPIRGLKPFSYTLCSPSAR